MVSVTERRIPFPFIEPGHPFAPQLECFRAAVGALPGTDAARSWLRSPGGLTVHAEIKGVPLAGGEWALDRFYWSCQATDPAAPLGFRALTLNYAATTGALAWASFPEDPYLPGPVSYLPRAVAGCRGEQNAPGIEVLRYVPSRRLTFRLTDPGRAAHPVVGKFRRRSRCQEGYGRLVAVAQATARAEVSFAVAAPAGIDAAHALYWQEALPGENLAVLLARDNAEVLLHRVGGLHREIHELRVQDIPEWDFGAFRRALRRDLDWIAFCQPTLGPLLETLGATLERILPAIDRGGYTFCHGDFACSQILKVGDHWSVIDFDLGQYGDPYREIAMLLTSLPYDVPLFQNAACGTGQAGTDLLEAARATYLAGYEARAGRQLDRRRLLWYRLAAEITYLAMTLKKDWFQPRLFERGIEQVRRLGEELRQEPGAVR